METNKSNTYWDDYDAALSDKYDVDREAYYKELDEIESEPKQAAEPKGEYTVIEHHKTYIDLSGDDSSLDSRYH